MEELLFDMTGNNFAVERYEGGAKDIMMDLVKTEEKGAYVIARVPGANSDVHFINIIGYDDNDKMLFFDPYERLIDMKYSEDDISAIYLVTPLDEDEEYNE